MVSGGEFDVAKRTVAATKLTEGDEVVNVAVLDSQQQIILKTREGYLLKFDLEEIPEKKKNAVGVRGMKLTGNDCVESVYYTRSDSEAQIPYGERMISSNKLKTAKRDGRGTKPKF